MLYAFKARAQHPMGTAAPTYYNATSTFKSYENFGPLCGSRKYPYPPPPSRKIIGNS